SIHIASPAASALSVKERRDIGAAAEKHRADRSRIVPQSIRVGVQDAPVEKRRDNAVRYALVGLLIDFEKIFAGHQFSIPCSVPGSFHRRSPALGGMGKSIREWDPKCDEDPKPSPRIGSIRLRSKLEEFRRDSHQQQSTEHGAANQ